MQIQWFGQAIRHAEAPGIDDGIDTGRDHHHNHDHTAGVAVNTKQAEARSITKILSREYDVGSLQGDLYRSLPDTRHHHAAQTFFSRRFAQQVTGVAVLIDNQYVGHRVMEYLRASPELINVNHR
jgi:hypothetical protein